MKPLLILTRIIFVGCFWSIFFLEGIRVIMLRNWRFDIFRPFHWQHAWDLWLSGWVIDDPKEWAFVLIILTFIPLWLTGWAALSLVNWEKVFLSFAMFPMKIFKNLFYKPVKIIAKNAGMPIVKKKKSYKEIRPRGTRAPISDYNDASRSGLINSGGPKRKPAPSSPSSTPKEDAAETNSGNSFEHSLFKFDDNDDDFDFNFDAFDKKDDQKTEKEEKSPRKGDTRNNNQNQNNNNSNNKNKNNQNNNKDNSRDNNKDNRDNRDNKDKKNNNNSNRNEAPQPSTQTRVPGNSSMDIVKQKGYEVITGATIKNHLIDFIGVADKQICLCLMDKEPGDWLADEERFNDEEPLWFSESSHRISPVRKVDLARRALADKLAEANLTFEIKPYVVVQIGNIINAEDMFDTWNEMNLSVTRIDRGTPKELRLFSKTLDDAGDNIDKDKFEKIKKLIRSIA